MRLPAAIGACVAATCAGAALAACVDLFHSTSDLLTACQLDAATPGCSPEGDGGDGATPEAGTDFCAWSSETARAHAQHACAWLGACETPFDENAFGACMFHAMLAYDCGGNPDHPVLGKTHDLWDCLQKAQSCTAVASCVFPKGTESCNTGGSACATRGGAAPNNTDVSVQCTAGQAARGENCALWGQTCGLYPGVGGVCGGTNDPAAGCQTSCAGTLLHVCAGDGGTDIGLDCASNGASACVAQPTWGACAPSGNLATCTPSLVATCNDGIATSCPAGKRESVNCGELMNDYAACSPGMLDPSFDWTFPCSIPATAPDGGAGGTGDAGACVTDSCSGNQLAGCFRGVLFPLDCGDAGLGACQMAATTPPHAACTPPPSP